ncbi:Rieske [2Fe-2S] domain protein [Aspergillus sclerotiicarbonarius CBS 121057]|uniref:Rieske [2Fe-2S] domain protein n=1 Tax=Aspergillus sclerotiicarbonarius (strain CBS 121057 / IBT 28362) TaxID=1448318 RepID=A0A319DYJ5_ASPSB|nr:Rieske [2Fe-2S] domain protein [Aspergillus sclerotiicarbonarius CBS 121057]
MFPFFQRSSNKGWQRVGLLSDFPDVDQAPENDSCRVTPSCKAFTIPNTTANNASPPSEPVQADIDIPGDMKDQVLVFKYKGKMHAIDHQCPHSAFPLSQGSLFDIEDFGVVLSAGITCPKHDWSFDLFSGQGDRGNYKLKIWEVQLRDLKGGEGDGEDKEVWVRRKQRIG